MRYSLKKVICYVTSKNNGVTSNFPPLSIYNYNCMVK